MFEGGEKKTKQLQVLRLVLLNSIRHLISFLRIQLQELGIQAYECHHSRIIYN